MPRLSNDHRDMKTPRKSKVQGELCPGMWVEDPSITLARNINLLLAKWQKEGHTLIEFCRVSGVPKATLRSLRIYDSWPEPGTLMKIASTLGVPIEVLFRR